MKLPPFLLDRWLQQHEDPPVEFNLGGSTGPRWTLGEVLDLDEGSRDRLFGSKLVYAPSAGRRDLRAAIAGMQEVLTNFVQLAISPDGRQLVIALCGDRRDTEVNPPALRPGSPFRMLV